VPEIGSEQVADSSLMWLFDNNRFCRFSLKQDGHALGIARNIDCGHNL
jgi:hypothetical protein